MSAKSSKDSAFSNRTLEIVKKLKLLTATTPRSSTFRPKDLIKKLPEDNFVKLLSFSEISSSPKKDSTLDASDTLKINEEINEAITSLIDQDYLM